MKLAALEQIEQAQLLQKVKRNQSWQIVFIALFTSLLAFFVLVISMIELEGSTAKRNYQKLVYQLYVEVNAAKEQQAMSWLNIENTLSKGVRITMDPNVFAQQNLFAPARAKVNPRFMPYINRFVTLLNQVDLPGFPQRNQKLLNGLLQADETLLVTLRVEGHTDGSSLAKTALYRSNFELSTFRAFAIMDLLRLYTHWPDQYFSIAGYGSFRPITDNVMDAENRRVEIYLVPQIIETPPSEPSL